MVNGKAVFKKITNNDIYNKIEDICIKMEGHNTEIKMNKLNIGIIYGFLGSIGVVITGVLIFYFTNL